jgi:hypothetical protein
LQNYVEISIVEADSVRVDASELMSISPVYDIRPSGQIFREYGRLSMTFSSDIDVAGAVIWRQNPDDESWAELQSSTDAHVLSSPKIRTLGLFVAGRPPQIQVDAGLSDAGIPIDASMADLGLVDLRDTGPPVTDTGVFGLDAAPPDGGLDSGFALDAVVMNDAGPIDLDAAASDAAPPAFLDAAASDATSSQDATANLDASDATVMDDLGGVILGQDASSGDGSSAGSDATNPPLGNADATVQMSTDALPSDGAEDGSTDAGAEDGGGGPAKTADTGGPPP